MSSKPRSWRRLAGSLLRHSFGPLFGSSSNKSSGDDHQMDTDVDDPELQRNCEVKSELSLMGHLAISDPTGDSFTNEKDLSSITPELVQSLYSEDVTIQLEAAQKIRKLLSDPSNLPMEEVIKPGAVLRFVHFLEDSRYPELQFESAWVLTKMAFDNSAQTQVVIESGAVPILIGLISSSNETVVEQSIWALGNIAGNSTECRDLVLNSNILSPLLGFFNDCNLSLSIMRKATWILFNLCDKNVPPNYQQVSQCLPLLDRLMFNQDGEIFVSVCWALAFLGEGSNEQIQVIIESGVCPRAVQLLSHSSTMVVNAALRLVRKITTGDDSQAQVLINENLLPALFNLLFHEKECIVENACRTLGKITDGNEQQIQAVIESNLISSLIELLQHRDLKIRQQAAGAIRNSTANGAEEQIVDIVGAGAIPSLCKLLSEADWDLTDNAVRGLVNILRTGEIFSKAAGSTENPYANLICNSPEMMLALDSEDTAMQLDATKRFDKLLVTSDGFNLLIDEVIKMGAIPRFVHFLENSRYPELQLESASVLTNITGADSPQTQVVIDAGAVPNLIRLLSSSNENVVKESVWTLGNIACYSTESRALVLNSNVLPLLLGLFNNDNLSTPMMRIVTWTLARLCKNSPPNFEQVSQCLPLLTRLMINEDEPHHDDEEMLINVCVALSHLCDGPNDQIQVVIDSGVCSRAIQLLSHTSNEVVLKALRLVFNITTGDESQAQVLIDANALPALGSLLSHEMESIVEYACWALANLCDGPNEKAQVIIESDVCLRAIQLLSHSSSEVVFGAIRLVGNFTMGDSSQTQVIINANALLVIGNLLSHERESIVEYACWTLSNITTRNEQQIQAVIDGNLLPSLIELLHHGAISVRKWAAFTIKNVTASGTETQIVYIVEAGAISSLCKLLSEANSDLTQYAVCGLVNIIRTGELSAKAADSTENPYASLICNSPSMKLALYSEDTEIQLDATKRFDKLLETSDGFALIIDEVIKSETVPRFVSFLEDSRYPELQVESASVLIDITHGTPAQTQVVIASGAVPILIKLLTTSSNEKVLKKSVHVLGNIACYSAESRDLILNSNVLPPLLGLLNYNASLSLMRIATRTLYNLCGGTNSLPNFEQCLPLLARLMVKEDEEVLEYVCKTLSSLCDGPNEQIQVVIESGVGPRAVQLLSHTSIEVVKAALRLVMNITAGDDSHTQVLINENALPALGSLLSHEKESIVENACRTLSKIAAGNEQQVQAVIDASVLPSLIELLHHGAISIRREVARALNNATNKGCKEQIVYLVEAGALAPLCKVFSEADSDLAELAIICLARILHTGQGIAKATNSTENSYATTVVKSGVCPRAVQLLSHTSDVVMHAALILVGYIAMGDVSQTQVLINANALPALFNLLFDKKESIVENACWALSNITAGNEQQIQAVIDANILPSLIVLLHHRDFKIRKKVANAIANVTSNGSEAQIVTIVEAGAIPPLCQLLSETDSDMLDDILVGLTNILHTGEEISNSADSTKNRFATFVKQCEGLEKIVFLSSHNDQKIKEKASTIIEKYFT